MVVSILWHVNLFLHPFPVLSLQTPVYTSLSLSMLSEAPAPNLPLSPLSQEGVAFGYFLATVLFGCQYSL